MFSFDFFLILFSQIEFKILYMIQLWADTFMMHEDEFPYIMSTYRQLRQEGTWFFLKDFHKNQTRDRVSCQRQNWEIYDSVQRQEVSHFRSFGGN